jgi:cellulose synthase/poly-beta-1,6-N-acetylglucosamine synthase-like glycosyltransferase
MLFAAALVVTFIGFAVLPSLFLLAITILSFLPPRAAPPPPGRADRRFAILIPAHDEERAIGGTLEAIAQLDYPRERVSVHVVADNCTDLTAVVAGAHGACVHERVDPARGKGAALNWLTERVLAEEPRLDAVVIVDADCAVSPNFLRAMDARLEAGARVVQALDFVDASDPHPLVQLRALAFQLICGVRPRAYAALGATCGLYGTGMSLTAAVASQYHWDETSVTEDLDLLLRFIHDGVHVAYAPEATVRSAMPASFADAGPQALRWERGKLDASGRALRAAVATIRAGNWPSAAVAVAPALVPPLSVLVASIILALVTSVALSSAPLGWLAAVALVCVAAYVIRGTALARPSPYRLAAAVLWVPGYIVWKCFVAGRVILGQGRGVWTRTARAPVPPSAHGRNP